MSSEHEYSNDEFITDLFRQEWKKLIRYAKLQLRNYKAPDHDIEGRAEDAVQEVFFTAYDKVDELRAKPSPVAWLYVTLFYKIKDSIREERKWIKGLQLIPPDREVEEEELAILEQFLSPEDLHLLHKIYNEGYTYEEMASALGISKTALAVRVHRIKKGVQKKYQKIFREM